MVKNKEHFFILCLLFLCFLLLSPRAHAWAGYTHTLLAQESLRDVSRKWHLDAPVTITPFNNFLKKLSKEMPAIQTREDFANWLKINPKAPFDSPRKGEKIGQTTSPLQILVNYSPKPDDNRDKDLPYDRVEQFWFGKGTKTVSQAFRHMEKPAFDLWHPLNTAGFPLGSIGQATKRAQIYFDLALLANHLQEPFWAWNFLGCALHYIEDLQQPYHSAQLLPPLAVDGVRAYFEWGFHEKFGLIKTVTHVAANAHHFFEGYVDHILLMPGPLKGKDALSMGQLWREKLGGETLLPNPPSIEFLAKGIRNFSNRYAFDTVQATLRLTDHNLLGAREYHIDSEEEEGPSMMEDPLPFFSADNQKRSEAAAQISKIVLSIFDYQGKAIRRVIRDYLDQTANILTGP